MYKAGVFTISDKGFKGEREDKAGPEVIRLAGENGYEASFIKILPDDLETIADELAKAADSGDYDLILTTGGTGFAQRDVTPEATLAVGERQVPGIPEAMRAYSMTITERGMLSRGQCVIRGKTLILNLPGSVKAVRENLEYILPKIGHGIRILTGDDAECGRE